MRSKTYAICWDGSLANCLDLESQLSSSDLDYLIYNVSAEEVDSPHWVRAENIRYYGHFYNALKDFAESEYDIFIFNAGDPVYSDWVGYTKRVEKLMSMDSDIYAIAPNTINDPFSGEGSFIGPSSLFKNLDLSTHTNGIHVSMTRELAVFFKNYMDWAVESGRLKIPTMTSGWGLDTAYCALAVYWNKKIYRDTSLTVFHPPTSSTVDAVAANEMAIVMESFKEFCKSKGIDDNKLQTIYDITYKKVRGRINYRVIFRELYVNLKEELHV